MVSMKSFNKHEWENDVDFSRKLDTYVKNSGSILNIDIGYNTHSEIGWSSIYQISESKGCIIHNAVTKAYKKIYHTTPVEYLCEYVEKNSEDFISKNVHTFVFKSSCSQTNKHSINRFFSRLFQNRTIRKYLKNSKYISAKNGEPYVLNQIPQMGAVALNILDDSSLQIPSYEDIAENLFLLRNLDNFKAKGTNLNNFEKLQQIFINVVSDLYERVYDMRVVEYSTIMLYITRDRCSDNIFIHYAVIFSKNLDFLHDEKFLLYISGVSSRVLSESVFTLQQQAEKEALKSAKAAIMSRNMSHNLGSHVMFYIKQKLQSVSKIIDNKVLDNIIPGSIANIADIEKAIRSNKSVELPFLVGLGRFVNYLQERQDYIATIATDYIPANSTISFKDFVYDELKPDLRYERHYSKTNDAGWKPGNLLLDYIAYSEGYRSCDDIKILFGEFNGHEPQKGLPADADFQKLREFNIAVPGGVIGRQAIFSIFENIIRNAAKHSERRKDNKLVLQLSLVDENNQIFQSDKFITKRNEKDNTISGEELAKLYDVGLTDEKDKKGIFDKYHILRIKIDMPNDPDMVKNLVTKLADPYIEDGHMNESSKGLKEMRISAAWLRGYSIDTEIPANEPPALSIYTEPYVEDNSKVTISYIVCLPKPCKVAFVVECDNSDTVNGLLTPYGCKVFTPNLLNSEDNINEIANYEIVCMSEDNRDLCSRISSRYIANQDKSAELLKELKCAITKNYEEILKQEAEQAQIEAEKNPTEENKKKAESAKENLSKVDDIKKKAINDAIGFIYEEWFNAVYNDITPKLVVADEKAVENKKANKENGSLLSDNNVILTATGNVTEKEVSEAIVYSTHFKGLATENDKKTEPLGYNKMLEHAICIEAVTGNNSTARLIRQDEWTKEWKTKLISAGLANVAIFDERIFGSFISRESKAYEDDLSLEKIINLKRTLKRSDFKNTLLNDYKIPLVESGSIYDESNENKIHEKLKKYLDIYTYKHDVAQKNHERRIWAFDIKVSEQEDTSQKEKIVYIVGYNARIDNCVGEYNKKDKSEVIIRVASIIYNNENNVCKVKLCDKKRVFASDKGSKIFDYITIHQGVLDKIYTAFGIKNDTMAKRKVTNALHHCFSRSQTPENSDDFLPNFIIHSGRSKPSEADMPQHQPFVQFAAVDHAVKDCKYTLVELLATAHYEKSNNNK